MPKKKTYSFEVLIYKDVRELPKADQELMEAALIAKKGAYAPYSEFHVGAAVRMANGEIVFGSNQENASYPSGLCAERVAIFQAGARFPEMAINAIAVTASCQHNKVSQPAAPCGNCRQAINEYEVKQKSPIRLLLKGETDTIVECTSMADILPLGFDASFL
jgi:cytidine deaminase